MSACTHKPFDARCLDVARFALDSGELEGTARLADFPRVAVEAAAEAVDMPVVIGWQAQGKRCRDAGLADGIARPTLHLRVQARLPLVCQRCLHLVWVELAIDRDFLFVPDEAQAVRLDERAENDVLVSAGDFDLFGLIEDELLLALPLSPRHSRCPQGLRPPAQNAGSGTQTSEQPHPFAALAALKRQGREPDDL